MEWNSRRTSLNRILIPSWQHFCRLVADYHLTKLCNTVRYTLGKILVCISLSRMDGWVHFIFQRIQVISYKETLLYSCGAMNTVPSVHSVHSFNQHYLYISHSSQVSEGTVFRIHAASHAENKLFGLDQERS